MLSLILIFWVIKGDWKKESFTQLKVNRFISISLGGIVS